MDCLYTVCITYSVLSNYVSILIWTICIPSVYLILCYLSEYLDMDYLYTVCILYYALSNYLNILIWTICIPSVYLILCYLTI